MVIFNSYVSHNQRVEGQYVLVVDDAEHCSVGAEHWPLELHFRIASPNKNNIWLVKYTKIDHVINMVYLVLIP